MLIRPVISSDFDALKILYQESFPENEGALIGQLAEELSQTESSPPTLSLIAHDGDELKGHIAFTPIFPKENVAFKSYILAPLAVKPECQKQGVGSALIAQGKDELLKMGISVVLVYGDPAYYGRFGFSPALGENFVPPYKLEYAFGWQAMLLNSVSLENTPYHFECVSPLNHPKYW